MPQLGETVVEGTITKWLKKEGETVERDEPLFEISTDKVDTEVPSPLGGKLVEIKVQEGETVQVGTELAIIDSGGDGQGGDGQAAEAPPKEQQAEEATEEEQAEEAPQEERQETSAAEGSQQEEEEEPPAAESRGPEGDGRERAPSQA